MALSFVLLTSCASNKAEPDQWLQDKDLVVQSLQDAHVGNSKVQEHVVALENRISALEQVSTKQTSTIDALRAELEAVKKQSALVNAKAAEKPAAVIKTQALNKRLDDLSAKLTTQPVKVVDNTDEKNKYTAAYLALKSSRYEEASMGFSAVVKEHPKGEFTDQAYYWMGESLVAQRRNREAIEAFTTVANMYPNSPKHAAALLKLASTYESLNMVGDAKAVLTRVTKEHPDSRSAERARVQLANLSQEAGVQP